MNTERRSKTRRGVLVALLLLCFLAIIGSTYSRYTSEGTADASVSAAKWAVKLGEEDISGESSTIDVNFTTEENEYVAENKIAPSVTATGEIELDLTGTEVGVDITAVLDSDDFEDALDNEKIKLEATIDGTDITDTENLFTLDVSEIGEKTIDLKITWENDESNNSVDTASGIAADDFTIPVKVTVQQHIKED